MKALQPESPTFMLEVRKLPENGLAIVGRNEWFKRTIGSDMYEVVRLYEDKAPLVIEVSEWHFSNVEIKQLRGYLRDLGYHSVSYQRDRMLHRYARSWAWPVLKAQALAGDATWALGRWLWRHHLIGVTVPENVVVRVRNWRPRIFGWRKLRHWEDY